MSVGQATKTGALERFCIQCKQKKPVTEFVLWPDDKRCADCIPDEVYDIKSMRRLDKAQRKWAVFLDAGGEIPEVPQLADLLTGLSREFGGVKQFCHDLVAGIRQAEESAAIKNCAPPKWCTDARFQFMKLVGQQDKLQQRIDEAHMTERQLKAQERLRAMEVLFEALKERELAVPLVRELKRLGLGIDEQTIDSFAAGQVTKDEVVAILEASERQEAADV